MKPWAVILAWLMTALPLAAQTNAPVRLALVSDSDTGAAAVDVLTAELSGNPQVQLLERDQIAKAYHEQGLSAANTDYLKLGQVLGADGLLVFYVDRDGNDVRLHVRLVAVHPGVVLVAEEFAWSSKIGPEWAAGFARRLGSYLPKLTVLPQEAVPISVVGFHSAVSSDEAAETERQMNWLTIGHLSRERRLFVLERQKMELMTGEQELESGGEAAFWGGRYLLEAALDRNGYSPETMTISARLTPPNGGPVTEIELRVSRTNLDDAARQLASRVTETLNLAPGPDWKAADEASEFLGEAKWAYRWGQFTEAQAASESAWALGLHTEELADLRIHAYADDDLSANSDADEGEKTGIQMARLARALELYGQDAPLIFRNPTTCDKGWRLEGIELFRKALGLLETFYTAAELRPGREDALAHLRSLARSTWKYLEATAPSYEEIMDRGSAERPGQFTDVERHELENYEQTKWEQGGLMFDQPEEALPFYRQLLAGESAYRRPPGDVYLQRELPRLVGWNWNDRKRVPAVTRRFIEECCASPQTPVRIGGLRLKLVATSFYPEPEFHACEQAFLDALWADRAWIFSRSDRAGILGCCEIILRHKYGVDAAGTDFNEQPYADARKALLEEYLSIHTNFDTGVFEALFPQSNYSFPTRSADEARELVPLLEAFPYREWNVVHMTEEMRYVAGLPSKSSPQPAQLVMPAEESLVEPFVDWKVTPAGGGGDLHPEVEAVITRGSRLWARLVFLRQYEFPNNSPVAYEAVDLRTGQSETLAFPKEMGTPDDGFEATEDSLYVSTGDHVVRRRLASDRWESVPVPITRGTQIVSSGGKVYLSTKDSVLETTPDLQAVKVLASSRRQPPVNEADPFLGGEHEIFRANGRIGLCSSNQIFLLETNGNWSHLPGPVFRQWDNSIHRYYSDEGVMMFETWPVPFRRLMGIWFDGTPSKLLLEYDWQPDRAGATAEQPPGPPLWDWPDYYRPDYPCVTAAGRSFWLLHPRRPQWVLGQVEISNEFQDDRQATVLHFEPGFRQVMTVPVRFEKDGLATDPFDFKNLAWQMKIGPGPFLIATPAGLAVVCQKLAGHWLISNAELGPRLQAIRTALRKKARTTPATNSVPDPTRRWLIPKSGLENQAQNGGRQP